MLILNPFLRVDPKLLAGVDILSFSQVFGPWDIAVIGPWEEFSLIPNYKKRIEAAFPELRIYDPEKRTVGRNDQWVPLNLIAYKNSAACLAMMCGNPSGFAASDAMAYYLFHSQNWSLPLPNLIIVWPSALKPDFAVRGLKQLGQVTDNLDTAIKMLAVAVADLPNDAA